MIALRFLLFLEVPVLPSCAVPSFCSLHWDPFSSLKQLVCHSAALRVEGQPRMSETGTLCSRFDWCTTGFVLFALRSLYSTWCFSPFIFVGVHWTLQRNFFFPTSIALAFKICLKHITALIHLSFDEDTGFCMSKKLCTVNSVEAESRMKCSPSSERKILGISVEKFEVL